VIGEAVPTVDPSQYTLQYELLRSQVIGTRSGAAGAAGQPRGVGLALLLREGMPGWLRAVEVVTRAAATGRTAGAAASPASEPPGGCRSAPAWLPGVPRHELTALLTSLVLSTRPVAPSSAREEHRSWH